MFLCSSIMVSYVGCVKDVPIFVRVVYLALVSQDVPIFTCTVYLAFNSIYFLIWFTFIWPFLLIDLLRSARTDLGKQIVYFIFQISFIFGAALIIKLTYHDQNRLICRCPRVPIHAIGKIDLSVVPYLFGTRYLAVCYNPRRALQHVHATCR